MSSIKKTPAPDCVLVNYTWRLELFEFAEVLLDCIVACHLKEMKERRVSIENLKKERSQRMMGTAKKREEVPASNLCSAHKCFTGERSRNFSLMRVYAAVGLVR